MKLREVVARNLRRLRNVEGLSQDDLADRAGISHNYIGSIEREEYSASVDMLEKIAEALGVDPVEFFQRSS